jgi:hypothetical protein
MQNEIDNPRCSLWQRIKKSWNPTPIEPPKVDPEIEKLDALQRSAEAIRYSILSTEFWLSPTGQVREWFRHNGRLALWLAIPGFLVVPVITWILFQVASWLQLMVSMAGNVILLPILIITALVLILVAGQIVRGIFK